MSKSASTRQPDELAITSLQARARLKQVMPDGTDSAEEMMYIHINDIWHSHRKVSLRLLLKTSDGHKAQTGHIHDILTCSRGTTLCIANRIVTLPRLLKGMCAAFEWAG